ncbi:jacalin-like lectin [Ulvibacterium sp.]|uniref:jacalin-like lectin n=1 Tax=Ulvibacterium sp. TaxID=2665914 RepID=UPI003CC538BC
MKTAIIFLGIALIFFRIETGFGQEEVVLPDHKPLLGEIHYGNRVGGIQAQEGRSVQIIAFEPDDVLKSIQVYISKNPPTPGFETISGFQFEVEKAGEIRTFSFGSVKGIAQKKYLVPDDRKLVGISGASGWLIDSMAFVFDDGSTTPKYGGIRGDLNFRLVLNTKPTGEYLGRLMGFWGSSIRGHLETIGLVFWPME